MIYFFNVGAGEPGYRDTVRKPAKPLAQGSGIDRKKRYGCLRGGETRSGGV